VSEGGHPVVVVDAEVLIDLCVVDTGIHAVELDQFVAEFGDLHGPQRGTVDGIVGGLGVEQDHAHVGLARGGQAARHLMGDQTAVREPAEDERTVEERLDERQIRLGHGLDRGQERLARVHTG